MKKCPHCAEDIQDNAKKCRFCGEFLEQNGANVGEEKELFKTRPTFRKFIGAFLFLIGFIVVMMRLLPKEYVSDLSVFIGVGITTGLLFLVISIKYVLSCQYTITSNRVIVRKGILAKHVDEIEICHIRSVNLKQGIWGRILGYGSVLLGTAGTAGIEINILDVINPGKIKQIINEQQK